MTSSAFETQFSFFHTTSLNINMGMIRSLKFSGMMFFGTKTFWISWKRNNNKNPGKFCTRIKSVLCRDQQRLGTTNTSWDLQLSLSIFLILLKYISSVRFQERNFETFLPYRWFVYSILLISEFWWRYSKFPGVWKILFTFYVGWILVSPISSLLEEPSLVDPLESLRLPILNLRTSSFLVSGRLFFHHYLPGLTRDPKLDEEVSSLYWLRITIFTSLAVAVAEPELSLNCEPTKKVIPHILRIFFWSECLRIDIGCQHIGFLWGVQIDFVKQSIKCNSVNSGHMSHRHTSDYHLDHDFVVFKSVQLRTQSNLPNNSTLCFLLIFWVWGLGFGIKKLAQFLGDLCGWVELCNC